jgi:hypothetical protein
MFLITALITAVNWVMCFANQALKKIRQQILVCGAEGSEPTPF